MAQFAAPARQTAPVVERPNHWRSDEQWWWLLASGVVMALIGWLVFLGRPFRPPGALHWWNNDLDVVNNSQHLADGYSLLHLSFGALVLALVRRFNPALGGGRLALTIAISAAVWEGLENLPSVIALFSLPWGAASYRGDSIVNALSDVAFAGLGFALARRLSWLALWVLVLTIEIACAVLLRDGLLLGTARLLGLAG